MKTELELLKVIYNYCCHPGCSHEGETKEDQDVFYNAMAELIVRFGYTETIPVRYKKVIDDLKIRFIESEQDEQNE